MLRLSHGNNRIRTSGLLSLATHQPVHGASWFCNFLPIMVLCLIAHGAVAAADVAVSESKVDSLTARFGIVGDGQADDSAGLQSAVDSGIGAIRLPKGVYRLTKPIVIDLNKVGYTSFSGDGVARILMDGPGPALKFVGTHFGSAAPKGFKPAVWERQRMPLVDGLGITGRHPESIGIQAVGTMQLTVTRVFIRGVLHAIHLVENNRNVLIADSHLFENRGVGIYYDNVNLHQSNISNCHISYNAGGGIVCKAGNVRNIHITGCDIESNMSPDTPPTANVLIDCRTSKTGTGEVAITGCTIQHNSQSPDSANIRVIGRSEPMPDAEIVREGHVTITGNVLSDVQVNVHLKDCRGVTLQGNTFWMGYKYNLVIEDSSNIVVGPNNFDRNPRYRYGTCLEANNSLVVRNCVDCTLTGLHVTNVWRDPAGVLIENCDRLNLTNCTILDCDNVGLLLKNVCNSHVSGCLIRDDRPDATSEPLKVVGGKGNLITHNMLGNQD